MSENRRFYKIDGDDIHYVRVKMLDANTVIKKWGTRGGTLQVERKEFPDIEQTLDYFIELFRKYREEYTDHPYHYWTKHHPVFDKLPDSKEPNNLVVEIINEDTGFLHFKIILGEHKFVTRFSDVFDPFKDLRRWLEAVSIGVEECSFTYATEGEDPKFNFCNWGWNTSCFYEGYSRQEMGIVAYVDRKQFVRAFYTTFLDFLNSNKFERHGEVYFRASDFKSKIVEEYLNSGDE